MFDRYVSGSRPSWRRRAVLIASLALHGVVALALLVLSFFHVAELTPPALAIVFVSAPPPPPGGDSSPRQTAPHPRPRPRPVAVRAPTVQPTPAVPPPSSDAPAADTLDPTAATDSSSGGGAGPGGPGAGPGIPGGTGTGPITSMAPPPRPINVPPHRLDAQRISGNDPHLPSQTLAAHRGERDLMFVARLCVDQSGAISQVSVLQSLPGADNNIIDTLRRWRYKPQPIPVCFVANFVFDVDATR